MSGDIPTLLEESLPSFYSERGSIQNIPTIEYDGEVLLSDGGDKEEQVEERDPFNVESGAVDSQVEQVEDEKENSALLEKKKEKSKFSFGKMFKGKPKTPKNKKAKKGKGDKEKGGEEDGSEEEGGEAGDEEDLVLENAGKDDEGDEEGPDNATNIEIKEETKDGEELMDDKEEEKIERKKKKKKFTDKFKSKGKGKQKAVLEDKKIIAENQSELVSESGGEENVLSEPEPEEAPTEDGAKEEQLSVSGEERPEGAEEQQPAQLTRESSARAKRKVRRQELLEKRELDKAQSAVEEGERPRRRRKKKPPVSPRGLPAAPPMADEEQPDPSSAPSPAPLPAPVPATPTVTPPTPGPITSGEEVDGGVVIGKKKERKKKLIGRDENKDTSPGKSTLKKLLPNKKTKGGGKEPLPNPPVKQPSFVELTSALGVTVHYAEQLYPTLHLTHPMVRVHLLDSKTGLPLPSTLRDPRYQHVLPTLTCTFDLRHNRTMSPAWEENLLFPESFESVTGCTDAVALFEIIDLVPVRALSQHKTGWSHIAWAFLKLTSGQGGLNVGRKLRLQLYKYPVVEQPIERLWVGGTRTKYPSTLYITLHRVADQQLLSTIHASQDANRNPAITQCLEQQASATVVKQSEETLAKSSAPVWSRAPGQMCKIPKTLHEQLVCPEMGCLLMSFSKDGRRLAAGCVGAGSLYPILIYSVPECQLMYTLAGHHNIIYELCWNKLTLLSASSDCTARTWKNGKQDKVLSHPSFVYCAKWVDKRKVLTGSYDRVIRLWDTHCTGGYGALLTELHGHSGHVNSIAMMDRASFYSGDSKGQIIEWSGSMNNWSLSETINPPEFKGQAISSLVLHPNGRRLFVMTKDSFIRLIDLRIQAVTQRYTGHTNTREHINCTVSPCGSYLFAASEDGNVYTWMVETGELSYSYRLEMPHSIADVQFHPHDNYLAIAAFGSSQPILVYNNEATEELPVVRGVETVSRLEAVKERLLTVSPTKDSLNTTGLNITLSPRTKTAQFSTLTPYADTITLGVLHDYIAQRSDEISLEAGEKVKLLFKDTDGWWVGENKQRQQGYFPANHVSPPSPYSTLLDQSLPPLRSPAARRLDFNQTLNSTREWQTFDSDDMGASPRMLSPGRRTSDNESVASSNISSSRRRRQQATAKVSAQNTPQR